MRSPSWWQELGSIMQPAARAFVRFAIDGDASTNHLYRQHVKWERLMANVDAFLGAGGNAEWDFIVFEHNEHQVEAMRSLAEQKGFTKFNAKKTARFIDKALCNEPQVITLSASHHTRDNNKLVQIGNWVPFIGSFKGACKTRPYLLGLSRGSSRLESSSFIRLLPQSSEHQSLKKHIEKVTEADLLFRVWGSGFRIEDVGFREDLPIL